MSLCNDESSLPYNKFGQQNGVTIEEEEEDEGERQPVTNEHGEDEDKTEEQIGEEDLHFPPSFVCWSQPLPIITSVSSNASYSSSSVASAHGDGDGEQHSEDNDVQQQKQQQNGECLFEQIAKLAEMDSFENNSNAQQQSNGRHCTADGYEEKEMAIALASCQPSPILNGGANAIVVVANEQPKIGKSNNNWALSSTSASASSSARRKSFNPVRIKEEPMQTKNDGQEHGAGAETTAAVEQQQQKQHSQAFNKRHDEGEEGADDEQMGPINRQQMNNKVNLFMDNNNMTILSSTTPLNAFTHFPPQLFPLEADEEESSADCQLQKDDGDEDDASVREKKLQYNNLGYFARFLKTELAGACAGAVDKVVGDFSTTSSSSSASNGSSVDNNRDHVDEQYAQQCQQQQHQNAVQQQQFQAVQARLWTAALALAATRQQQQQQQHQLLPDQQQPQFVPAAAGTCRPPASQPPFSLASSMVVPSCTMRGGGGMAQLPNSTFPWFSVPTMPTMNSAAVATLFAAAQQNPFFSTAIGAFLANAAAQSTVAPTSRGGGGIFPPPPVPTQSTMAAAAAHNLMSDQQNLNSAISAQCSPTNGHYYHHKQSQQHNNYPLRLSHRSSADCDDSPRRKRAKVTDCVRGPRSSLHRDFAAFSAANTPQLHQQTPANSTAARIVPTMVPRASELDTNCRRLMALRCGAGGQNAIDGDSGDGTGQMNATGDNDELAAISINPHRHLHRAALTHMHLRKAKLMFFYQRYPTSSLLKSYFPDVQFTKQNTAQLVKWFSNFREFFYMQMEKFAKQAIAEGVQHADEIYVTTESEVFKQLQQHYNKNNAFQPPERLLFVIQETLKEFYNALKEGRDKESSWKKAIYKVIQQLDETIPEFFREPQFVELLEQNN